MSAEPTAAPLERLAGKYLTFKLGPESYGLPILKVRELIGLLEPTPVPGAPPFVRGIVNLRGRILPVVDLPAKLGMPPLRPTDQTVIVVVQISAPEGELALGMLVDEVLEVLPLDAGALEPPPPLTRVGAFDSEFLLGVGRAGRRMVFLLDIDRVLSTPERAAVAAAAPTPA